MSVGVGEAALGPFALVGVDAPDVSVDVGAEVALVSGELGPFALVDLAVGDPMDPPEISVGVAGGVAPVSVDISIEAPACSLSGGVMYRLDEDTWILEIPNTWHGGSAVFHMVQRNIFTDTYYSYLACRPILKPCRSMPVHNCR